MHVNAQWVWRYVSRSEPLTSDIMPGVMVAAGLCGAVSPRRLFSSSSCKERAKARTSWMMKNFWLNEFNSIAK